MACIPTLGPVFSPQRFRSKYNAWSSNKALRRPNQKSRSYLESTNTYSEGQNSQANKFGKSDFRKLDEESADIHESTVELQRLRDHDMVGAQAKAAGTAEAVPQSGDFYVADENVIGIRTDLSVFPSNCENRVQRS